MSTLLDLTLKLEQLCDEIDSGGELPDDLLDRFSEAKLEHTEKVGNYVHLINRLRNDSAFYSERSETLARRAKTCERVETAIKARVKSMIESFPDLPWKSPDGDKFWLQKSKDSLCIAADTYKRTFSNVVMERDIELHKIPVKFIDIISLKALNTENIREHLKNGNELEWARLISGTHLRMH